MHRADLKYLSPYEFTMYWKPELLTYSRSAEEDGRNSCEASLTARGRKKCVQDANCELVPGEDYVVKDSGGDDWVALENVPAMATLRHQWMASEAGSTTVQRMPAPQAQTGGC